MNQNIGTISVIIPYYNGSEWISRSLSSVLAQTLLPGEIIIIDDGSKEPLKIEDIGNVPGMERVTEGAVALKILQNAANRGIPATRNIGIKVSTGEWIAFLDQDDEWMPNKLERQFNILSEKDHGEYRGGIFSVVLENNVHSFKERVSPKKTEIETIGRKGVFESLLLYGNFVYWITLMVHRECFDTVGYLDEDLFGGSDDYDFALRVSLSDKLLFDDAEPVAIHYVHDTNYSHALKFFEDNKKIYDKYKNVRIISRVLLKKANSRNFYMAGRYWHVRGKWRIAINNYSKSIICHATLKNVVMFASCFLNITWMRQNEIK